VPADVDSRAGAVRRSAIEAVHARLGARWVSPLARWPADYGDPARESRSAGDHAGLADLGPLAKLEIRGPGAGPLLAGAGLGLHYARVDGDLAHDAAQVWGVAPDEAIVLGPRTRELAWQSAPAAAVVDLTSALSLFRLVGPNASAIVRSVSPLDIDASAFPERSLAHAPLANVRVAIARLDWAGRAAFALLLPRDYAQYVWETLLHVGRVHGLTPIGSAALEASGR
jgi:heterotetrameric sarcosine oxidase gamma subunit